jgi:hypothetical protein
MFARDKQDSHFNFTPVSSWASIRGIIGFINLGCADFGCLVCGLTCRESVTAWSAKTLTNSQMWLMSTLRKISSGRNLYIRVITRVKPRYSATLFAPVKACNHKFLTKHFDFPSTPSASNCGEQTVALYLNMTVLDVAKWPTNAQGSSEFY